MLFHVLETEAAQPRNSERVQSVDRAFTLLERLADGDGPLTLSELAELTDLPMPTIHRSAAGTKPNGPISATPFSI